MGVGAKLARLALLAALTPPQPWAQQRTEPRHVLLMHWYDRTFESNIRFDQEFQAALTSAKPGAVEYYSEYLETNKFPGEDQSQLLSDYLRKKYADRPIDVVVARSSQALSFLLAHRQKLFRDTPIAFATERPVSAAAMAEAAATGVLYMRGHAKTIELALRLHPATEHLFVVSGTLNHDRAVESIARDELGRFQGRVTIEYLTDLPVAELRTRVQNLPGHSLVLYVWQQSTGPRGRVIETQEIAAQVIPEANAPVYGISTGTLGLGVVGGYVWTPEAIALRLVDITMRLLNGQRPSDIPIESVPDVPKFDWRQLQRWGIREESLPPGRVLLFRSPGMWEQYKWRIVVAIVLFGLQAFLIGALLVAQHRSRRNQQEIERYQTHLGNLVQERTVELVEARDQAVAANRSKSVFLATMSHELRTPLNAILGFSRLVMRDRELPEQHRKDLAIVGRSGENLLGLIDDVLDMAKIEAGLIILEIAPFDLHNLLDDIVNMLQERARARNLELLCDKSPRVARYVRSDPGKLRQILTNLIGNALKYTDEGSVVLRVDGMPGERDGQLRVIFDVEDTGIGIAPEQQERIFEPFVQAEKGGARKGVGLGLAITQQFVKMLGGSVGVESVPGRGSCFHVEIPVETARGGEVAPNLVEHVIGIEPGQPVYRILIVEDQRENWLLLLRLLETAGFQVRVAEDGGQALDTFGEWRPHFIWMDLRLPVMGGMETVSHIRQMEGGREVKIAAVTASVFSSQREEILVAGFDDFLRKPYRPREIFDCMARHLGVRYVYAPEPGAVTSESAGPLRGEDLAALPPAIRDELEVAVVALDRQRIAALARRIAEQNPALGSAIAHLAATFAYTAIFNALENCKGKGRGNAAC
ncbi:MAG: ATP-binding protein [Candidatus Solibacter sp.]